MSAPSAAETQAVTSAEVAAPSGHGAAGTGKVGMWMFLATDAMGFGAMFIAYAVLRVRAETWPDPYQRLSIAQAAAMTFALAASSLTMSLAVLAARAERPRARAGWLAATVALGLAFAAGQALEWTHLLSGPQPMGLTADAFASTFYALTGFHGAHVVAGLACLVALLAARARATAGTLEVVALFWHFVDFAWVAIFCFVYLLPTS
jgi:heme/copper-type cytochrome/quinol oxidase subunit 3